MSASSSASSGPKFSFAFRFGGAGGLVRGGSDGRGDVLSVRPCGSRYSRNELAEHAVTLQLLRKYCDLIHDTCIRQPPDNHDRRRTTSLLTRAVLGDDDDDQQRGVSAAVVGYWTRKFLAETLSSVRKLGQDRARADILKYLFVWRAVTLFHLPLSLSPVPPPLSVAQQEERRRQQQQHQRGGRLGRKSSVASLTGADVEGADEELADEPPVSGVL